MATDQHHVIIGNGVAGNRAATVLRERDPDNRITIISIGGLLFYDRYQLPQVFEGKRDWRDYLVHPPDYYEEQRISVRRKCRVTQVDPRRRVLMLAHREEVGYDTLLIASGGGGYLPPRLAEYAAAVQLLRHLPRRARHRRRFARGRHRDHARRRHPRHRRRPCHGRDRPPGDPDRERAGVLAAQGRRPKTGRRCSRRSSGPASRWWRTARSSGSRRQPTAAPPGAWCWPTAASIAGDVVMPFFGLMPVARVHGRLRRRHRARPAGQPEAQDHRRPHLGGGRRLPDLERRRTTPTASTTAGRTSRRWASSRRAT